MEKKRTMNRTNIANYILRRMKEEKDGLINTYHKSQDSIGYFILDDLLPEKLATDLFNLFPEVSMMNKRSTLRENKYYSSQMNKLDKIIEETIFSFHDRRVLKLIKDICGFSTIYPDTELYAGGISTMKKDQFLNPHIDNSHDRKREKWRILNLLYYVTPQWKIEYGGNLELWVRGLKKDPLTIHSKFNRLVVMAVHESSWHSVSKVIHKGHRCCISNYYFSDNSPSKKDNFYVTSFRGRPNQKIRNLFFLFDNKLRMFLRKVFPFGVQKTKHFNKI